jgi:hypothetical protein
MLKRTIAPPSATGAEPKGGDDPGYLAKIRRLPCLHCGMEPSEAAHVKYACASFGMSNMLGKRVDDSRALPLCAEHHRIDRQAQHQGNERAFWERLGIQPYLVTKQLYAQRDDPVAMLAVVTWAIMNRSKT